MERDGVLMALLELQKQLCLKSPPLGFLPFAEAGLLWIFCHFQLTAWGDTFEFGNQAGTGDLKMPFSIVKCKVF